MKEPCDSLLGVQRRKLALQYQVRDGGRRSSNRTLRYHLLADVEVVATYRLHNLNRTKLENIFHRLFGAAQLDLTIEDRFGNPVKPREWFLVPLHVIDEAVQHIRDRSITDVIYDPKTASLIEG